MPPRDFKQRPARKRAPQSGRRTSAGGARWPWFGAGVCVGALLTAGLLLYEPVPGTTAGSKRPENAGGAGTGTGAGRAPRFEFYTLLPEKEIAIPVPEKELRPAAARPDRPPEQPAADAARYLLQVGSFRRLEDADRLKAQLAFLGLSASIQTVSIDGNETWHRVRVGPLHGRDEVNEARARLASNDMDSLLLKLK